MKKNIGQSVARKGFALMLAFSMLLPAGYVPAVAFANEISAESQSVGRDRSEAANQNYSESRSEVKKESDAPSVSVDNDNTEVEVENVGRTRSKGSSQNDKVSSSEEAVIAEQGFDEFNPPCPLQPQEGRTIVNFNPQINLCSIQIGSCGETTSAPVSLTAGIYKVTLVAQDGHPDRDTNPEDQGQLWEQYDITLTNPSGYVTRHTAPTADLEDGVEYATNYDPEDPNSAVVETEFVVEVGVTEVIAHHSHWMVEPGADAKNSVYPVCAAFDLIEDEPDADIGSISICKLIMSDEGDIATSSDNLPAGEFSITLASSTDFAADAIATAEFSANTFTPNANMVSQSIADLNNDGAINEEDRDIVLENWGDCPAEGDCLGDIVSNDTLQPPTDGKVDGADLGYVLWAWSRIGTVVDAECIKYEGLEVGHTYYYSEESITGTDDPSPWQTVLYSDKFWPNRPEINTLDDVFPYSSQLFDEDPSNDDAANTHSDGKIVITPDRADRTLLIVNTYDAGDDDGGGDDDDDDDNGGGGGGDDDDDDNNGGGGSSGGRRRGGGGGSAGEVLGVSTDSCYYLRDYLKIDWANDPIEVAKLQLFLKTFEGFENLQVTTIFDQATFNAVSEFQNRYFGDILEPWGHTAPTGFVYILTKKKVNEIFCSREFPLNQMQQQEIVEFRAFFTGLNGMGGIGNAFPGGGMVLGSDLKGPMTGEISATSTENTRLAEEFRNENDRATQSLAGALIGDMSFSGLASAVFSLPADRMELIQCVYYLLMILVAIYILGTILANAQNTSTHTRDQIARRRLVFFIIGTVIAVIGSIWLQVFCLIVPLLIILAILIVSFFIGKAGNRSSIPETSQTQNTTQSSQSPDVIELGGEKKEN